MKNPRQRKELAEIWRALKPGGRILIADMRRPSASSFKRFFTSLVLHHGHRVRFGIEDLPKLLREAGFEDVEQLDVRFLNIGFVRVKKAWRLSCALLHSRRI